MRLPLADEHPTPQIDRPHVKRAVREAIGDGNILVFVDEKMTGLSLGETLSLSDALST